MNGQCDEHWPDKTSHRSHSHPRARGFGITCFDTVENVAYWTLWVLLVVQLEKEWVAASVNVRTSCCSKPRISYIQTPITSRSYRPRIGTPGDL